MEEEKKAEEKKTKVPKAAKKPAAKKLAVSKKAVAVPVVPSANPESRPRIRIKVRAYDNKIIDQAVQAIIQVAERNSAEVVGPVPLPTEKRKYTVNRSTFVHKDAREQFEMRVHKRLIDILEPTPKVIDAMMSLNLPSGVDVEVKM